MMDYCRLCAKSDKKPLIPILDNNPLKIHEKIEKFLRIKINESSNLPKMICLDCLSQLNTFDQFQQSVSESQIILSIIFNEPADTSSTSIENSADKDETSNIFIIEEISSETHEQYQVVNEDISIDKSPDQTPTKKKKFDRFDCYVCQEKLPGNHKFVLHFNECHPKHELQYTCFICESQVRKYRSYIRHLDSHQDDKKFHCDICNKNFSQKIILAQHLNTHSEVKSFKCDECGLSFKQNASLFKHRKQKHTERNSIQCEECKKFFVNSETLRQHMRSKHTLEKNISCADCGKTFASQSALRYHVSSHHTNDSEIKCKQCSKQFKSPIILQRHVRKFHES